MKSSRSMAATSHSGFKMKKRTKVLLTGGAGYLGSIITKKLLQANFDVIVVDRMFFGESSLNYVKKNSNLKIFKADIRDSAKMAKLTKGVDYVIHLAGLVGDAACNNSPQAAVEINYLATKSLASLAKKNGAKKFIFASTCSVYGYNQKLLSEVDELNPLSVYAMTKVMAEIFLVSLLTRDFKTVIFRMATLYGLSPRMRFDLVINSFCAQATVGDKISLYAGNQWRPFIHVADAAQAYILAAKAKPAVLEEQVFNLADEKQNYQIYKVADLIKKHIIGSKVEKDGKINESRNYRVSSSKIERTLNFQASYTVEDGVLEMYHEILKNKKLKEYKNKKFRNSSLVLK